MPSYPAPSRFAPAFSRTALAASLCLMLSGCATEGTAPAPEQGGSMLPGFIASRWTPPAFGTRLVEEEAANVLQACLTTANNLGYSVVRYDGARGRISATRRQAAVFDTAREDSLEITVTTIASGSTQVALVLRETTETDGTERSTPTATSAYVRERGPYDAFFARLESALRPADAGP